MQTRLDNATRGAVSQRASKCPSVAPAHGCAIRCRVSRVARTITAISSTHYGSSSSSSSNQHLSLATSSKSHGMQRTLESLSAEASPATVRFWLKYQCNWGQTVKLIGSHPKLGSWLVTKSLELKWAEGDFWTATVTLPAGFVYEYKYVVMDASTKQVVQWQTGGNSVLAVEANEQEVEVHDNWGNTPGSEVRSEGESMTREGKLQLWAKNLILQHREAVEQNELLSLSAREGQLVKGEMARLKMEMGLMQQTHRERDMLVAALKEQNSQLQEELQMSRSELNSSFSDALKLLEEEDLSSLSFFDKPRSVPRKARVPEMAAVEEAADVGSAYASDDLPKWYELQDVAVSAPAWSAI